MLKCRAYLKLIEEKIDEKKKNNHSWSVITIVIIINTNYEGYNGYL